MGGVVEAVIFVVIVLIAVLAYRGILRKNEETAAEQESRRREAFAAVLLHAVADGLSQEEIRGLNPVAQHYPQQYEAIASAKQLQESVRLALTSADPDVSESRRRFANERAADLRAMGESVPSVVHEAVAMAVAEMNDRFPTVAPINWARGHVARAEKLKTPKGKTKHMEAAAEVLRSAINTGRGDVGALRTELAALVAAIEALKPRVRPSDAPSIDWRTSGAHQNLLCHFRSPKARASDLERGWEKALGEPPANALARLVREGHLVPLSLARKLERLQTAEALRALLRERELPVSGTKSVMTARLLAADPEGMTAIADEEGLFDCSESGMEIARERDASLAAMKDDAVSRSLALIRAARYEEAFGVASAYKAAEAPHRFSTMAGPFSLRDPAPVVSMVATAAARPAIFGKVSNETWEALRIAVAMSCLWGGGLTPWMPGHITEIRGFDLGSVHRMMTSFASSSQERARWRSDRSLRWSIGCGSGCCDACRAVGDVEMSLDDLPEIPFPGCQNTEVGCHCRLRLGTQIPGFE